MAPASDPCAPSGPSKRETIAAIEARSVHVAHALLNADIDPFTVGLDYMALRLGALAIAKALGVSYADLVREDETIYEAIDTEPILRIINGRRALLGTGGDPS
jgi:hypothetical protein